MDPKTADPDRRAFRNDGCMRLIEAIVRQAAHDHLNALKHLPDSRARRQVRETEAFFRSAFFCRLTGVRGSRLLRMIREEAKK